MQGCNYIMDVVSSYYPDVEWEHTGGYYDRHDMDWVVTTTNGKKVECKVEGKDRRKNRYGQDIHIEDYSSAYLNSGKFSYMVRNFEHPYAVIGYADGVIIYNLKTLPAEDILSDICNATKDFMNNSSRYDNQSEVKVNDWTIWKKVWNPAKYRKDWELSVELPISSRDEYKGITVLYNVEG